MARRPFSRRGRLDIIYNILSLCLNPAQKTHIMYQVNLSYAQLQKYLKYLAQTNLFRITTNEKEELYIVTPKGREFIEEYQRLLELLE